jgi:hypothetical protein
LLHAQHDVLIGSITTYCQQTSEKLDAEDWANSAQEGGAAHLWLRLLGNLVIFTGIPSLAVCGATWWSKPGVPEWVTGVGFGFCGLTFVIGAGVWLTRRKWFKAAGARRAERIQKSQNADNAASALVNHSSAD